MIQAVDRDQWTDGHRQPGGRQQNGLREGALFQWEIRHYRLGTGTRISGVANTRQEAERHQQAQAEPQNAEAQGKSPQQQ
ncbi:hypothetical protein D3C75_1046000 [compost metagenome]